MYGLVIFVTFCLVWYIYATLATANLGYYMESQSSLLQRWYQMRFHQHTDYRNSVWDILCRKFFSKYIGNCETILDLGAGWGEFINNIDIQNKLAMDLNPETGERVNKNVKFINQDCSARWNVDTASLDVIFTSNFLEHMKTKKDIEETIREAERCLKPGGKLLCMGPNIKYVPGAYWDYWDHYVPLTDGSLSEVLKLNAFEIETCIPKFLPYTMSTSKNPPLFLLDLYLKFPLAWRIFGKQFFIVATKTS